MWNFAVSFPFSSLFISSLFLQRLIWIIIIPIRSTLITRMLPLWLRSIQYVIFLFFDSLFIKNISRENDRHWAENFKIACWNACINFNLTVYVIHIEQKYIKDYIRRSKTCIKCICLRRSLTLDRRKIIVLPPLSHHGICLPVHEFPFILNFFIIFPNKQKKILYHMVLQSKTGNRSLDDIWHIWQNDR